MFDRYSERARRVLFFARYELSQCGGETIEPAHLLLGMLRDAKTADRQFASRNISPADLRRTIEQRVRRGARLATLIEDPFAPATKRVLKFAAEEADRLLQHIVQPGHLLLALFARKRSRRRCKPYRLRPWAR
jgi:ATP-dependent Clp protease ATP-binding subunit ClpC